MSEPKPTLRDIKSRYSPDVNPLMESLVVPTKKSRVSSGLGQTPLIDGQTGEVVATTVIHQITEVDTEQFVKVFLAGINAIYELTRPGQRVFQAVLAEYERTDMHSGFAAAVALAWFDGGLSGRAIDMSEKTFNRGLRELLDKGFIAPKTPGLFWVNPSLFFKGDRVRFVKEYRRAPRPVGKALPASTDSSTPDVVAGDDPASSPRVLAQFGHVVSRERTEPQHPAKPPVVSGKGSGFSNKKKKSRR